MREDKVAKAMIKDNEDKHTKRFRKMKIQKRIMYGYKWAIGLSIALILIAAFSMIDSNRNFKKFVNGTNAAEIAILDCRLETNIAARAIREMIINDDKTSYDTYVQKIEDSKTELLSELDILKSTYEGDQSLLTTYEDAIMQWFEVADEIVGLVQSGKIDDAKTMILTKCAPALQELIDIAKDLTTEIERLETRAININTNTMIVSVIILIVLLASAVLICSVLARRIARSISEPLQEIEKVSAEMAKGNLKQNLTVDGEDEVTGVADSLDKSLKILSGYVEDIDRCMKQMSDGNFNINATKAFIGDFTNIETSIIGFSKNMSEVLQKINDSAENVADSSEQIADSSMALTQGATDQSASVEELQATVTSIAEVVDGNAKNAKEASEAAEATGNEVWECNNQMQNMVEAMEAISKASNEIGNIIGSINEIAEQTNLLALNASIEAARAGDAGKGFAVVADEVGKLAAESSEAAKNSSELIGKSLATVETGMNIAQDTAKKLEKSADNTKELVNKITMISEASENQAVSLNEITGAVEQISSVVEENTAMAEESSAASQEMAAQADLLKQLLEQFEMRK